MKREILSSVDLLEKVIANMEKLGRVAEDRGTRNLSVGTGLCLLLLLVLEFVSTPDYVPAVGEIVALVVGGMLVGLGVVVSSLEYKWYLDAKAREGRAVAEQLRLQADYNLERLAKTQLDVTAEKKVAGPPK